jgi:hypothetical protein
LEEGLATIQRLSPFLFDLAKFFPAPAAKSILSVLQEKYDDYRKNVKVYPTLETVSYCQERRRYVKIPNVIFPNRDWRNNPERKNPDSKLS